MGSRSLPIAQKASIGFPNDAQVPQRSFQPLPQGNAEPTSKRLVQRMDCCSGAHRTSANMAKCPQCNRPGRNVSPLAVAHNLTSATELSRDDGWELCLSGSECNVVYFHDETVLEKRQLRSLPYHKDDDRGRLVCFCFGHTVSAIAREVNATGGSTLQVTIRDACRRGETDCERLNPQGRCCLGNIAEVIEGEKNGSRTCG